MGDVNIFSVPFDTHMDALIQFPLVVFFAPMVFALALWAVSSFGLLGDHSASPDADVDADIHADADLDADADGAWHGNVLHWIGVGMIPLPILLSLMLFLFGWLGLGIYFLLPLPQLLSFGIAAPASAIATVFLSAGIARKLRPLFESYGHATRSTELVGKIAILSSTELTPEFGLARVKLDDGNWIEISVRAETAPAQPLAMGAQLVLTEYEAAIGVYYATPFEA